MSSEKVSIAGLKKACVLAALYNRARPQGMGFMHYVPEPMYIGEAEKITDMKVFKFDYLRGRVMKVDISGDEFDPWGFDRDNGEGAAQATIDILRETGEVSHQRILEAHIVSLFEAMSAK